MGIGAADEGRRVNQLHAGDILDAEIGNGHDLVAGAGGDAEDLGVVAEETEIADGGEEVGEGLEVVGPVARGPEARVLLVGGEVGAREGEVAGGFGEAEVRFGRRVRRDAGVGGAEEEGEEGEGCYGYGSE